MKKNIVLTGEPGVGKSTLLKKVIEELKKWKPGICYGLLTEEIKEGDKRVGFKMANAIIAHVDLESETRVSRYGIERVAIEKIALAEMRSFQKNQTPILYLDEIGQMQLHSEVFKKLVKRYFDSKSICIATLSAVYHSHFTRAIRRRKDIVLINVTPENREELTTMILVLINKIL